MEINQIKYFLSLAKFKHFTLAAEELCISQSSLSKQIKTLEQELGVTLFHRNTRNIKLTAFGEEFIKFSEKVIQEYNDMNLKLKEHLGNEQHKIIIGAVPVMNQYGITGLIASFQKNFPLIHIEFVQKKTKELISLLENGEIDLAFFLTDSIKKIDFQVYPVIYDELVLVTDENHPLVNRKSISFSEISEEKFVFFDAASGMHEISIDSCKQAGFTPNILYNCNQVDTMLELVSEGLGVALLMEKIISYFNNPRIKTVHFENPVIGMMVMAVAPKKKITKNVNEFLKWCQSRDK